MGSLCYKRNNLDGLQPPCLRGVRLWLFKSCIGTFDASLCLQAIETLKSFEKKDSKVASTAATNLSFLYFLVSFHGIVGVAVGGR